MENGLWTLHVVEFGAICILCHTACGVPLSLCRMSDLRYDESWQNLRRAMILEKKSRRGSGNTCCRSVQNVVRTDLQYWQCYCRFVWEWNLVSNVERRSQIEGLWMQGGEGNIWCEREEGLEGCRRFCSELHVCYTWTDIITIIEARRKIYILHVASI